MGRQNQWGTGLHRVSGPPAETLAAADLVVLATMRNEVWRLPFWLAYHRWLGVQQFVVISNRSNDGTVEFLSSQPDVTVLDAPCAFEDTLWKVELLRRAPARQWNLILDADELFVSLPWIEGGLRRTIGWLDSLGAEAAVTTMVDCYPESLPMDPAGSSPVPWERAPYFDRGPYFTWDPKRRRLRHRYAGVRERLFYPRWRYLRTVRRLLPEKAGRRLIGDGPPLLRKMPLLRNVPGMRFEVIHTVKGVRVAPEMTALLHFKLDVDFEGKVAGALVERPYPAMGEYEAYGRLDEAVRLRDRRSVRFTGPADLEAGGLLASSPAFEEGVLRYGTRAVALDEALRQIARHGATSDAERLWTARWGRREGARAAAT